MIWRASFAETSSIAPSQTFPPRRKVIFKPRTKKAWLTGVMLRRGQLSSQEGGHVFLLRVETGGSGGDGDGVQKVLLGDHVCDHRFEQSGRRRSLFRSLCCRRPRGGIYGRHRWKTGHGGFVRRLHANLFLFRFHLEKKRLKINQPWVTRPYFCWLYQTSSEFFVVSVTNAISPNELILYKICISIFSDFFFKPTDRASLTEKFYMNKKYGPFKYRHISNF